MSTIPTQTFTTQNYTALILGAAGAFVSVPVTLATSGPLVHSIPIQGIVPQDLTPSDLPVGQTYQNHQNFIDSNQDKHQTTSHDRGSNFQNDDNGFRNNRMRGRGGNTRTNQGNNTNGYGNRPRNPNKGIVFQSIVSSNGYTYD